MGAIIVVGLGHGMMQRSWVSAGALLLYLFSLLAQAGWRQGQPVLIVLALAVAYFLVQGVRATWWWREHETPPGEDLELPNRRFVSPRRPRSDFNGRSTEADRPGVTTRPLAGSTVPAARTMARAPARTRWPAPRPARAPDAAPPTRRACAGR